jgi:hypothetical protein
MDQKNLAFVPSVLPVLRGTVIEFHNSDDVQHNVFSPSRIAGEFDLGTYHRGESRSVTFAEPGEAVVLCNVHMEMEAHVVVLRDPYFTLSRADGGYEVAEVPPGSYRLRVWRRGWLAKTWMVQVPAAGTLTVDVPAGR